MRAVIGVIQVSTVMQKLFNRSRFSHFIGVSAGLFTNRLRLYSDPQAPWPPSPSVSSPETHGSGFHNRLLREDITGQDGGSPLSSSPLVHPAPLPRIPPPLMMAAGAVNAAVELAVPQRSPYWGSSLKISIIPSPQPILTAGEPENQDTTRHRG